tara:strand:- start:6649 stop:7812 length:1164 start_codon:yes stop_codon:yes gene_type:complete
MLPKLTPRFKPKYGFSELKIALKFNSNLRKQYEKKFSHKFNSKYGLMFSYGRTCIYSLLKVWELKQAEIICPAYTCVVVPHSIVKSNNIPVFVDASPKSFNMDLDQLKRKITPKTRCVILTHLFGFPEKIDLAIKIINDAERLYNHKIYVIQDMAHSYGCKFDGKLVSEYGDASIFGCNISKIINSIFGGMILTNNKDTFKKLLKFRDNNFITPPQIKEFTRLLYFLASIIAFNKYVYFWVNLLARNGLLERFTKYYDESKIDFPKDWNHLPTKIESRVGFVQLSKYDSIINSRIKQAKLISKKYRNNQIVKVNPFQSDSTYSHIVGMVENRDKFISDFRKKNKQEIGKIVDYCIPDFESYKKYINDHDDFPNARNYSKNIINFPIE